jgi:hypothetical protein
MVPMFTDESVEVGWAVDIALRGARPLVSGGDTYNGPLYIYALAAAFRIFGLHPYLPRVFVLVTGSLTVVAVFFLGRELTRGRTLVGLLAAGALATNPHHAFFVSHIAWSNCTTALLTTLALILYLRSEERPPMLLAFGVMYGFALQSHPSALALAPGLAAHMLIDSRRRAQLKTPWPYLGLVAALVGYLPVIYYNWITHLGSLIVARQRWYAFEINPSAAKAYGTTEGMVSMLGRIVLGSFGPTNQALSNWPAIVVIWNLGVFALARMAREGRTLPFLVVTGALAVYAYFGRYYENPTSVRIFMPAIPLIFVALSDLLVFGVLDRFSAQPVAARAILAVCVVYLATAQLRTLRDYYHWAIAAGFHNGALIEMQERAREHPTAPVYLDGHLYDVNERLGGSLGQTLWMLLFLDGHPVEVWQTLGKGASLGSIGDHAPAYLVTLVVPRRFVIPPGYHLDTSGGFFCRGCVAPVRFAMLARSEAE